MQEDADSNLHDFSDSPCKVSGTCAVTGPSPKTIICSAPWCDSWQLVLVYLEVQSIFVPLSRIGAYMYWQRHSNAWSGRLQLDPAFSGCKS